LKGRPKLINIDEEICLRNREIYQREREREREKDKAEKERISIKEKPNRHFWSAYG
jgi:hypothetical protein